MRAIRSVLPATCLPAVLASVAAFAQTPPPRAEFEVAAIKPSAPPAAGQARAGVQVDGAQVHCSYLSLKDYIRFAYKVKDHQISGPDWLASARFDIAAKLPAGATRDQVPEMLKALLEDRFQVKVHRETKEFPVYGLAVTKGGLKMKESPADPATDGAEAAKAPVTITATGGPGGTSVDLGKGSSFSMGNNKFEARKLSMISLAEMLSRFVDRPVVDMTELKGSYDFTLDFSPEDYRAMLIRSAIAAGVSLPPEALRAIEGSSGDSLFAALQGLGLKLESRKAPLEVLVFDQVLKTPTEN
jgi:uncharacterized protein (TIGR03435 family)